MPLSLAAKSPERLKDIAEGFRSGKLSVQEYLNRLKNLFDQREPQIRAFVPERGDRFERLLRDIKELEARFPRSESRPPLYGIPVGVKDIFHVDGFPTFAGSRFPPEVLAGPQAKCISLLKSAGVLILGKTVTTEFAYMAPGPTRNPHNPEHTPGGSSSGSAAAVAAGLCPLALGSQTIGSTLRPASFCGVVGFKPSYGRISADGMIPLSYSVDHVGFFTTDVESAGLVASVLCEKWRRGFATPPPVLGVPEGPYLQKASHVGLEHFRHTCARLSRGGFEIRPVKMFDDFEDIIQRVRTLVAAEAAEVHREWFRLYSELYHEKTAELIMRGQTVTPEVIEICRTSREKVRREIMKIIDQNGLSAFLAPAAVGPAPKGLDSTGDFVMNLPWTHAGLPAVSIPSGETPDGLPMGLQIVGRWWQDEELLLYARKVEILF